MTVEMGMGGIKTSWVRPLPCTPRKICGELSLAEVRTLKRGKNGVRSSEKQRGLARPWSYVPLRRLVEVSTLADGVV